MSNYRLPGTSGVWDDAAGVCRPAGFEDLGRGGNVPGPMGSLAGVDLDGLLCPASTPGTIGSNDLAARLGDRREVSAPGPSPGPSAGGSPPDHEILIIEVEAKGAPPADGEALQTTVENLAGFVYAKRSTIAGAPQDLAQFAKALREFGGGTFYVMRGKGRLPSNRYYLVFKGNPRKLTNYVGLRAHIRGSGPYSFKNPKVVQFGFGLKGALKAGARATFLSFLVVGTMDVVAELLEDEVSLARLGVTLTSDLVKMLVSMLGGVAVGIAVVGGAALLGVSVPVLAVSSMGIVAAFVVGDLVDEIDNRFGLTEALQRHVQSLQERGEWEMIRLLQQLEWCAMHPYRCFG